jgi:hypothetical protein
MDLSGENNQRHVRQRTLPQGARCLIDAFVLEAVLLGEVASHGPQAGLPLRALDFGQDRVPACLELFVWAVDQNQTDHAIRELARERPDMPTTR